MNMRIYKNINNKRDSALKNHTTDTFPSHI